MNLLCESGKGFLHAAAQALLKPPRFSQGYVQQLLLSAKPGWDPAAKAAERQAVSVLLMCLDVGMH